MATGLDGKRLDCGDKPLSCDCYDGCWGDHSKDWPEVAIADEARLAEAHRACWKELHIPRGSYVAVRGALRLQTEEYKQKVVEYLEEMAELDAEAERDKLLLERRRHASPSCCEASRNEKAIALRFAYDYKQPPTWRLRLASDEGDASLAEHHRRCYDEAYANKRAWFPPAPKFCPYCGAALPAIAKRASPPHPLCVPGDDYCETCHERLMNCLCWPPSSAWEEVE